MKPIGDKVLIKKDYPEEKTQAGIIIPDSMQDKAAATGVVVAIGSGDIPKEIQPGKRVIFDKYAGTSINIEGEDHLVMKEFNIMGVFQ